MDCPVTARPTVIVISDSLGDTACEVVLAASGQFDEGAFRVLRLPKVTSVEQVKSFVGPRVDADHRDIAVFHTIVDPALRARVLDYLGMLHIRSVDLIGPTLAVLSSLTGVPPKGVAGVIHKTDDRYFHRIEAMEYLSSMMTGAVVTICRVPISCCWVCRVHPRRRCRCIWLIRVTRLPMFRWRMVWNRPSRFTRSTRCGCLA